jgi:hypothetical protein
VIPWPFTYAPVTLEEESEPMSHFSSIQTQMVESAYLTAALRDLGHTVEEGDLNLRGFMWQKRRVQVLVRLRRGYDVGFEKVGSAYGLVADWWGVRGIQKAKFLREVTQRYAYHAAKARLEGQGFTLVSEDVERDGKIRLVLRRMV